MIRTKDIHSDALAFLDADQVLDNVFLDLELEDRFLSEEQFTYNKHKREVLKDYE